LPPVGFGLNVKNGFEFMELRAIREENLSNQNFGRIRFSIKSAQGSKHSHVSHMAKTQSNPLLTRLTGLITENEIKKNAAFFLPPFFVIFSKRK
jgi:hypothetical protein